MAHLARTARALPLTTARTISRRRLVIAASALALVRCGNSTPGTQRTTTAAQSPTPLASPTRLPTAAATATPIPPTPTEPPPTPTPPRDPALPIGFPLDPSSRTGAVTGAVGSRQIAWGEGATAETYSRDDQPSADAVRANRCGWNARVHLEYEGQPAIDWYIPQGTPILATMDGTATLLINTVSNPFDVYGVSREPYIGNPDRSRAPISPFPGPGGGQGVFVRIESASFQTDHAHLDLQTTLKAVPTDAFVGGYAVSTDFATMFRPLRDFRVATAVARWPVKRGQVVGFSGDAGYSEAPHLHYAIKRLGAANSLCPTAEPGFDDAGWLFR